MIHMEEERLADLPEVTIDDLEDNLTQHVEMQQIQESSDATDEMMEDIRAGLAALFEDGWTTGEMAALTQDEQVRRDIAEGHGVLRAACAYLRRNLSAPVAGMRRRGVPITRTTARGTVPQENRIEHMTDAQFDAFSRRAREAMVAGKRVRL